MLLFNSFILGGFECSTHRRADGRRLDLVASSRHEEFVLHDYIRLRRHDILAAREGLRWHLIEADPGRYDFSSVVPVLRAAEECGIQIIWDLFHYGWPDDIDIFSAEFIERFRAFSAAFARFFQANRASERLMICPVNEISFMAWAGGDAAFLNPFKVDRGDELKWQLVRANIASAEAVRAILPDTLLVQIDPVINILPNPELPHRTEQVAGYNQAQYAAWDAVLGRLRPELGGHEGLIDVIGVNYYPRNQWVDHGEPIRKHDPRYKPFRNILKEVSDRYQRPLIVAETGTENGERPEWFAHIVEEVSAAIERGAEIHGICLYPILNHPGWNDDRHCHNGLWDYANNSGERQVFEPLAEQLELMQEQICVARKRAGELAAARHRV